MSFRYFLISVLISLFCISHLQAIQVQVGSAGQLGKILTANQEGGGYFEEKEQARTAAFLDDSLNDNKEWGFCGLFSGYGITMKRWKNDLAPYYRRKFQGYSFEPWFKNNKLNEQLEPIALRNKVQDICKTLLNGKESYSLQDMCNKVALAHQNYQEQAKKIGSTVSAALVRFNYSDLFAGVVGNHCIAVFHHSDGLASQEPYALLSNIKNDDNCVSIGDPDFDASKCAIQQIKFQPNTKYFIVLMNKAVRAVVADQQIADIFRLESDNLNGLADRVSRFIIKKSEEVYDKMRERWIQKRKRNRLTLPELAVKIIILNEPFTNLDDPNQKRKKRVELASVDVPQEKLEVLLTEYAQESNDEGIDNLYNKIISEHPNHSVEKDQPTWWDRLCPYIMNKYAIGSMIATIVGYSFYTGYLKSFFSK